MHTLFIQPTKCQANRFVIDMISNKFQTNVTAVYGIGQELGRNFWKSFTQL